MTNFIPIFPLNLVVFPHERLNLHVFEPRYKQLIKECFELHKPFGIPVVLDKEIQEFGTLMEIKEITRTYKGGEMDIKTEGRKVFRVLEIIQEVPDKLFKGAIVNYPENSYQGRDSLLRKVLSSIHTLYELLHIKKEFPPEQEINSYLLAHQVGLNQQQEYEMLGFFTELHRLEYLKRHLAKTLPTITETEALKKKIKMNGHFKHISGG